MKTACNYYVAVSVAMTMPMAAWLCCYSCGCLTL